MTQDAPPVVDLIIPAFNEQAALPHLLGALPREHLRHVVVGDNGSTDRTAAIAEEAGCIVVDEPKRGYGAACLAALRWINAQSQPPAIVAFIDADLSDDPALLPDICRPIADDRADLVIAARRRLAEPGALSGPQRFGSWLSSLLIRLSTGQRFTDLGPMRAIRHAALQQLDMADRTWGWTVEMQFKAARRGMRCLEIDVPYRRRRHGESKISGSLLGSIRAGYKILLTIVRLHVVDRPQRDPATSRQHDARNPGPPKS